MHNPFFFIRRRTCGFLVSRTLIFLTVLLYIVSLSACSNTKYLTKDQSLLTKNTLELKGNLTHSEQGKIKNSLNSPSITRQQPNTALLNLFRLKLWLYNKKHNDKKTGRIWNWLLINKNMEPPVIYDSTLTMESTSNMISYLNNQGYFYATADFTAKTKKQKTNIDYKVNTGDAFLIDSINYAIPDSGIRKTIIAASDKSFLEKGTPFKVANVIKERERLTRVVRDSGYYHFSTEDIRFVVDTVNKSIFQSILDPFSGLPTQANKKEDKQPSLDLAIELLKPVDSNSRHPYYIRHIFVYPDYSAYSLPDSALYNNEEYNGITVRYNKYIIRPNVLRNVIKLESGKLYSEEAQSLTIKRLNNLGVWKFVNVEISAIQGVPDSLDCYIFLIPGKKQEVGANIETTTSAGDYIIGGALNLTYQNNNTHHSANQLKINLKSGLEWSSDSARTLFVQAREFSGEANVSFPRFITPFKIKGINSSTNPQTILGVGFNYLKRLNFFSWTSFKSSFGYNWNATESKQWVVNPFSLNYNHISDISPSFEDQLEANPFLKSSFSSVFIEGEDASFIFNDQHSAFQPDVNYFRANFEESGVLLNAIDGIIRGASDGNSSFKKLTSVNYSQYVKANMEYKHYFNRQRSSLVTRIYAGVGIPYGKSDVLPYIKQFTAGGPNSLRAWRLRSLGPGSYYNPDVNNPDIFPDQTGEMKLEGNIEYRFDIMTLFKGFMSLKGAVFVDAGNIWNLRKNPYKPGSEFRLKRLYQDIAIGSGIGIRLDFSYAILRLDVATPLKVPYVSDNYGWINHPIKPFDRQWRRNNMVFNFAVGYPF